MANMKQNLTCSRSKPPPARSSCYAGLGRTRGSMNVGVELSSMQTQENHKVAGDKAGNVTSGFCDKAQVATPKDVSECLSSWLTYLQMLNGLCSAGSQLSHSLGALVQDSSASSPCHQVTSQCQAIWEELVKTTAVASSSIKGQVLAALQEINAAGEGELDPAKLQEHNQQVVCGSMMTFVSLQYQFCAACCEFLGAMSSFNCCPGAETTRHDADCTVGTLQQCFSRLYIPPHPAKSPPYPLQGSQRRWSEAAAGEMTGGPSDGTMRRWSMPWESSRLAEHHSSWHGKLNPNSKLAVPSTSSQDRSRSTTPDSIWHSSLASQDELQEVLNLLSCRPSQSTQLYHASQHLPGVTLTSCPYDGPPPECGMWSESSVSEERNVNPPPPLRGSISPKQQRASWHVPDNQPHMWGEQGGENTLEVYSPGGDPGSQVSRKSSSSTDSSSSHSLHSKSTTGSEGSTETRSHLYSMWSGNDLSFMKLPESSEPSEPPQQEGEAALKFESPHTYYTAPK